MNIKVEIPEGYEIDKEKSTFENIVLKEKAKYKAGDWVKLRGDRGVLWNSSGYMDHLFNQIIQLNSKEGHRFSVGLPGEGWLIEEKDIVRLATKHEIAKKFWKPGELYFIKEFISDVWSLRYATNTFGKFYINQQKEGNSMYFKCFQLAEGVVLPDNSLFNES